MSKLPYLFVVILLVSACKPVAQESNKKSLEELRCIDSQSECVVSTKLANFTVKFSQHQLTSNIKAESTFTIELALVEEGKDKINKHNITNVSAHLEGRDMYMGKVPVFFKQNDSKSAYLAETLLASCSGAMVWRLWITAEIAEQEQRFFVDFTSEG